MEVSGRGCRGFPGKDWRNYISWNKAARRRTGYNLGCQGCSLRYYRRPEGNISSMAAKQKASRIGPSGRKTPCVLRSIMYQRWAQASHQA